MRYAHGGHARYLTPPVDEAAEPLAEAIAVLDVELHERFQDVNEVGAQRRLRIVHRSQQGRQPSSIAFVEFENEVADLEERRRVRDLPVSCHTAGTLRCATRRLPPGRRRLKGPLGGPLLHDRSCMEFVLHGTVQLRSAKLPTERFKKRGTPNGW